MKIDLNDKVVRTLVQDYVNQICNYQSEEELNFDVHKLIHTFTVVKMADLLISETKTKLSEKTKKQILNAALLHDWGRCHEFKKGIHLKNIDHGKIGADLVKKYFPKMKMEMQSTLYHNKCPSSKDPKLTEPVLDYVRDADMLANILYEIDHLDIFLMHIVGKGIKKLTRIIINNEIIKAVQEKRPVVLSHVREKNLVVCFLWQLCFVFNLQTEAGKRLSKKMKLFFKFRELICQRIVPMTTSNKKLQSKLIKEIYRLFPDEIFAD